MPELYDPTDIGSIFRYQYGIYASFGMSYDEFWNYDYRLVESFKVKHDQDLDRDVVNNHAWRICQDSCSGICCKRI